MLRLQKNTSLALYSVLEFARDPERHISAAEIADKHDISPHHLAKVLAVLARSGVVDSVRGAGGGYRFTGNARRLTLLDIIQMFEEIEPPELPREGDAMPVERALGAVLNEIDANAKATFGSITLATMLRLIDRQQAGAAARGSNGSGTLSGLAGRVDPVFAQPDAGG
ncbi:MAG TPA: Rrf2 family transcriptional regulator [Albitalea sp.]